MADYADMYLCISTGYSTATFQAFVAWCFIHALLTKLMTGDDCENTSVFCMTCLVTAVGEWAIYPYARISGCSSCRRSLIFDIFLALSVTMFLNEHPYKDLALSMAHLCIAHNLTILTSSRQLILSPGTSVSWGQ